MASSAGNKFDNIWKFLSEIEIQPVESIHSNLICVLCNKILINAKQSPCGCRFCVNCITRYLNGEVKNCPGRTEDCVDYMLDLANNILSDNNANREISKLTIKCPNARCQDQNELRIIIDHFSICDYTLTNCLRCNTSLLNKDIKNHNINECELRISHCQFCNGTFDYKTLIDQHCNVEHEALCEKLVDICPNHCQVTNPILLKQHLPVCTNRPEPCPYNALGCQITNNRKSLSDHLVSTNVNHSKMLLSQIDNLQNDISTLKQENQLNNLEIMELRSKLMLLEAQFEPIHNNFLWRVEGFSRIKSDFVMSKSFLTSRYGYKMCLKLWPRVQMPVRMTRWVSVYRVLMHGQYDELLPRVFPYDITVSLVSSDGINQHTKVIKAGSTEREFGLNRFIEYDQLVADRTLLLDSDSIYIRCTVACLPD